MEEGPDAEEAVDGADQPSAEPSAEPAAATFEDLFGSEDEDEAEAAAQPAARPDEGEGSRAHASALDEDLFGERDSDEADDEDARDRHERSAAEDVGRAPPLHVEVPELPRPGPGQLCLVRLPNILGIEPRPFDPQTYDPDEEARMPHSGRENVIRWRYGSEKDAEGRPVKESNSRMVRWSDGSLTLHVGSEVLLATEQTMGSEHSHIFAKHTGLIECHGVLSHRLHFQPATRDSQTHQKLLAKMVAEKATGKERKIRMTSTIDDPEKAKEALERLEEEKKRLLVSQERRTSQFGGGGAGGWDSGFLEGDDDVDAGDLGAIRAQVTGRKRRASTPGNRAPRRRAPARPRSSSARRPASRSRAGAGRRRLGDDDDDDDEEEAEMSADDGDEDEMEGFIVDDDDDEDVGADDDDDL